MVGIAGGAPSKEVDLRLGDVVVSKPTDTSGGAIQFDFGKALPDGKFLRTGSLNCPSPVLLNAVSSLQAEHGLGDSMISIYLSQAFSKYRKLGETSSYLGVEHDQLFDPDYKHVPGDAC